jgi:triosephosphate isomerase
MNVRRKLVVGNWKMNGSLSALAEVAAISQAARAAAGVDAALCVPAILIAPAVARSGGLPIGAQDVHHKASGAHTGDISAPMLKEVGAKLVIVGHSERRSDHRESDETVRAKAEAALASGLQTIVCIGESDEQRAAGQAAGICTGQLCNSLPEDWPSGELVIAYEPIWAIGTGKVATCDDIGEIHAVIRRHLLDTYGDRGGRIRILYGGSVKPDNAASIFEVEDVDGALVGGCSLTADQFVPIIEAAARP